MKTKIMSHTFKGRGSGGYTYEITFNKSLEHTCRMDAMCKGLDKYDKWRKFWLAVDLFIAEPLLKTRTKWADKFYKYTGRKF
jgi:hypothetical protein